MAQMLDEYLMPISLENGCQEPQPCDGPKEALKMGSAEVSLLAERVTRHHEHYKFFQEMIINVIDGSLLSERYE